MTSLKYINGDRQYTPDQTQLLSYAPDHSGNAEAVAYRFGGEIGYIDQRGWVVLADGIWVYSEHVARLLVERVLRERASLAMLSRDLEDIIASCKCMTHIINGVMSELKARVLMDMSAFNTEKTLLPCINGTVDLTTGVLYPANPGHKFTWTTTVDYDQNADYTEWAAIVLDMVGGNAEMAAALQVFTGYCLTGLTHEEKMLYISGPPRSGKGLYTETFKSLFPYPISQEKNFNSFTDKREGDTSNFDLSSLPDCRVVFASESNRWQQLNSAMVKGVTGGSDIEAAYKGKDAFQFSPQFKIILTSNLELDADVDDDAIWTRIIAVMFPTSHVGSEDVTLKEKMRTPQARRAFLAWAVEGARKYFANGLLVPQSLRDALRLRREALDTVTAWLDENAELIGPAFERRHNVKSDYNDWCKLNDVSHKHGHRLAAALAKRGIVVERRSIEGKQVYVYMGIKLHSPIFHTEESEVR